MENFRAKTSLNHWLTPQTSQPAGVVAGAGRTLGHRNPILHVMVPCFPGCASLAGWTQAQLGLQPSYSDQCPSGWETSN